jgi:hypothetical protein
MSKWIADRESALSSALCLWQAASLPCRPRHLKARRHLTIRTMLNCFLAKDIMAFDKSQEAGSEAGAA